MNLNVFNDIYWNIPLQKIWKEKKNVFFFGDFNLDLLKYDKHAGTNEFLNSLSSYMLLPFVLNPTRVTGHSQTITDNRFSNYISKEAVCGNLIFTVSDHPLQVLFMPSMFSENAATKSTILKEARQSSTKLNLSWVTLINIRVTSWILKMATSMCQWKILLIISIMYLISMLHWKKISKYKVKFKTKPWIMAALEKLTSIKYFI